MADPPALPITASGARESWACPCVVLVSRGSPDPNRLIEGLRRRGADARVVTDPPAVMVELAQGGKALVVSEPKVVRRLPELLAAVRRYYPQVPCWRYELLEGDTQASLARFNGTQEPSEPRMSALIPAPAAEAAAPSTPPPQTVAKDRHETIVEPPLVTREELEMLLGGPDEGDGGGPQDLVFPENQR